MLHNLYNDKSWDLPKGIKESINQASDSHKRKIGIDVFGGFDGCFRFWFRRGCQNFNWEVLMAIRINLDVEMAKQKKGLTELAGEVDITLANLSILKNNKAKAVRLSTSFRAK